MRAPHADVRGSSEFFGMEGTMVGTRGSGLGQFSSTVDHRDGVAVVRVIGELDLHAVSPLRESLDEVVVDAVGAPKVVVDLTGLTFMDSTGLGALVMTQKKVGVQQGSFGLVCSGGPVLRLLEITGLIQVLQVSDTVDAAVARALD